MLRPITEPPGGGRELDVVAARAHDVVGDAVLQAADVVLAAEDDRVVSKRGSSVGTGLIPPATPPTPVSVKDVLAVVKCVSSAPAAVPR